MHVLPITVYSFSFLFFFQFFRKKIERAMSLARYMNSCMLCMVTGRYRFRLHDTVSCREYRDLSSCFSPHVLFMAVCSFPVAVTCGDPGNRSHTMRSGVGFSYPSTLSYSCHAGYILQNEANIQCLATAQWSSQPPECHIIHCPNITSSRWMTSLEVNTAYSSILTFSCQHGFLLVGVSKIVCQASGEWSGPVAYCAPINCTRPILSSGTKFSSLNATVGGLAHMACVIGFRYARGSYTRRCGEDGMWSGSDFECDGKSTYPL